MTVCEICNELCDGIGKYCDHCQEIYEEVINRECQHCGGYELDDGTSDLCYCYEEEGSDG